MRTHKPTLLILLTAALLWTVTITPALAQGNPLLTSEFWQTATTSDVRTAIANGADIHARGVGGITPLHLAAVLSKTPAVVELLLDRGANIGARDIGGQTPLHNAALFRKTPAVVELLLDRGADIHARTVLELTPLHLAASLSQTPAVVELLLDRGADIGARDIGGQTPLHLAAAKSKTPAVVELLLDRGADVGARSPGTISPPLQLQDDGSIQQADGTTRLHFEGAARLYTPGQGWTTLHWAAVYSRTPAVVDLLLDRGADVDARTENGWTPLHWATLLSQTPAVVESLLSHGADATATVDGSTPFDLASLNPNLQGTDAYWRLNDAQYQ